MQVCTIGGGVVYAATDMPCSSVKNHRSAALLQLACEKYATAHILTPFDHEILFHWGNAMLRLSSETQAQAPVQATYSHCHTCHTLTYLQEFLAEACKL